MTFYITSTVKWKRKWQPTPELLPGTSHGQKSLVDYSLWGCTESDTTEHTHTHTLNSESPDEKSMRPLFLSESTTSPLMNASFHQPLSESHWCWMIILWWTCSVSWNECWHEEFCRFPTARPMIPNVNRIGSCLHFLPLAPHPPFRPQHEAVSAESDTSRVVLWAHPGGKRREIFIDYRPALQERWLEALQGCLRSIQGRRSNTCQPPHMSWRRLLCSDPRSPQRSSCFQKELI